MRSFVATLLLIFLFSAAGCNEQSTNEEPNNPPSQSFVVAANGNKTKERSALLSGDVNSDSSTTQSGGSDTTQGDGSDTTQGGTIVPGGGQIKKEAQFLSDADIILILAGIIAVLVTVIFVLLYKLRKKKNPVILPTVVNNVDEPRRKISFRVGSLQNIGKRKEQQDSFYLSNIRDEQMLNQKGLLAVVADGMGGLEDGAAISKLVTDTFAQNYAGQNINSSSTFLYETARKSEATVEKYIERVDITGGSTLVAVLVKGNELDFISVGDSHIYLFSNGKLTQLNREHNYGEVLKDKARRGEVDRDEPNVNPQRHSLVAYIGMGSFHTVDRNAQPIKIKAGDKVFLCSDGVYNALGKDALALELRGSAVVAAKRIESKILSQNLPKQDNFTGVIVEAYEK